MSHLLDVYNRAGPAFVHGQGVWLYTADEEAWLDCVGGIATKALGHCHPALVAALQDQARKLWHISNMFHILGQVALATRLTQECFADLVFFSNSGTEAIECALKMARRYHAARQRPARNIVIGFQGSFHGRSHAALSAAGNTAYLDGCGPTLPGYLHLSLHDWTPVATAISAPRTAAVIVEPVQGEGGAVAVPAVMLQKLRAACDANDVLLIYDEVQSGMGRTGALFAHQLIDDAAPDIMTVAKALGGGFPVGACLATTSAASGMTPGSHGSTFGGNPLAMAVAIAAFDIIASPVLLAHVREVSFRLRRGLTALMARHPDIIAEVRGTGLLVGLKLRPNNRLFMAKARDQKLLIAGGGDNCVRLLPALTLTAAEADEALLRLDAACEAIKLADVA